MGTPSDAHFYLQGNYIDSRPDITSDNTRMFDRLEDKGKRMAHFAAQPFDAPAVPVQPAEKALEIVLKEAGATLPRRDAVDRRLVEEVRTGGGRIIDSQQEVGGWPEYRGH
jgi:hypothetical protein